MAKTYEELPGAEGRARFFRPARRKAAEVFAGAPPRVFFDDLEYALVDLSGSGLGCRISIAESEVLQRVNERGVLRLVQRGEEIFRGRARQARLDLSPGRGTAGFALEDGAFDLTALKRRNARALASSLFDGAAELAPAEPYRALCADMQHFIGSYLHRIANYFEPLEGELTDDDAAGIIDELDEAASQGWRALMERANELVLPLHEDKRTREVYKSYTERTVTRDLVLGPGWERSYVKPLGYPGDFQLMNWIYDGKPLGGTLAAKFINHLGAIATRPVRTRMQAIAEIILDEAALAPMNRAFDIASVGCGPARELEPVMSRAPRDRRFRATLIDQEPLALEYAHAFARRLPEAARLEVRPLNVSFSEMLNPSPMSAAFAEKDVIYSAGLVDYLNPLLARRFVRQLYQFVRPGGCVVIGNINNSRKGTIWSTEYAVDWPMMYRSERDMTAMAEDCAGAEVSVAPDALDAVYILKVKKPT